MKKTLKKGLAYLLAVSMIITFIPMGVMAAKGDEPAHNKSVKVNEDGTYTIALDVTGESETKYTSSNVVVVLDSSGSMRENTGNSEVTYTVTTGDWGDQYGDVNGQKVELHREWTNEGSYWNPQWVATYYYPWTGNAGTSTVYTGTRYTRQEINQTRMEAAQDAVIGLGNTLLALNGKDGAPNDLIEMALVDFDTHATPYTVRTTASAFENDVNSTAQGGGTNWEAALNAAKGINFGDEDTTYIIFVSDGNPTFRDSANGYNGDYDRDDRVYGNGQEDNDNVARCYNTAKTVADTITADNSGYVLYTIGVYGNVDRMEGLGGSYFSAEDTSELQDALGRILGEIMAAGIGQVEMSDGTTSDVTLTSEQHVQLLSVDESSYKYYRSGGTNEDGTEKYDREANGGLGVEWTSADNPAPPEAQFVNGAVEWNLSLDKVGVLENGVKYTVTFNCAPSQYTYDLIADLNNGVRTYESLDENIRNYLIEKNGSYSLLTNTETSFKYMDTREENPQVHTGDPFGEQDPVATSVSKMSVTKAWQNQLDGRTAQTVEMDLVRDPGTAKETVVQDAVKLAADNPVAWTDSYFIATGQMTVNKETGDAHFYAEGHDYTMTEPENLAYYWDLQIEIVRPMIINGTHTTLVKVEKDAPTIPEGKYYLNENGIEYYKVDGNVYKASKNVDQDGNALLSATNYRRSNLNLTKAVNDPGAPADATFTYSIEIGHRGESDLWFSVYDENNKIVTNIETTATPETGDTGYYYFPSGSPITVDLKAGWNLRLINLLTDSEYTITETGASDSNFTLEGTSLVSKTGDEAATEPITGTEATVTGTIDKTNTSYTLTYTNKYELGALKITKKLGENSADVTIPDTTTFTVTGPEGFNPQTIQYKDFEDDGTYTIQGLEMGEYTVAETNADVDGYTCSTIYSSDGKATVSKGGLGEVTVTNTYTRKTGDLTITKTISGLAQDSLIPAIKFTVTGPDNYNKEIEYKDFENGSYTITGLPTGQYKVEEQASTAKVANYTINAAESVVEKTVDLTTTGGTADLINVYERDKGSLTITKSATGLENGDVVPAGATFTVTGPNNYSKEVKYSELTENSITIGDLATGDYTVAETKADVDGYTLTTTYSENATVKVEKGKTAEVTVNNAYSRDKGSLTITKSATGLENGDVVPAGATFTVTGPNNYSKEVKYSELTENSITIGDLATGDYTVAETKADVDGYTLTTTYSENATVKVEKGKTAEVTVNNAYSRDKGSLTITKSATGLENGDVVPAGATFTVTGPNNYSKEVKYSELTENSITIGDLATGDYTVAETKADVDGYTLTTTYSENATVKVEKGKTAEVTVNNAYSRDKGSLTITKSATGLENGDVVPAGATFTVTGPNNYSKEVKYSELTENSITIGDLATGDYTVAETKADVDGYTLTTTYSENATVKVEKGKTAEVTVNNAYSRDKGSLTITKSATGLENGDVVPAGATFTVTGPNNYSKEVKYSELTENSITIGDLATGDYTVAETKADVNGYTLTTTYSGNATVKVEKGKTAEVTVNNAYTRNPDPTPRPTPIDPEPVPLDLVTDHIAYIEGYPDGTVQPEGNITRAEVATMIYRLLTEDRRMEIFTSEGNYSDMDAAKWFNKAVASMTVGEYVNGYPDGSFKPNQAITRAEFVTIVVRFLEGLREADNPFTDIDNHWAKDYILSAVNAGWIDGYPDGTFHPDQPIKRDEAMKIMNTILHRGVDENSELLEPVMFPDNADPSQWYYYEVIEATNNHEATEERPSEQWTANECEFLYDIDKYERPGV